MTVYVGFLVFPEFQILDLSGPLSVFDMATRFGRRYQCRNATYSIAGGRIRSSSGLVVETSPLAQACLDTFIVVGGIGAYHAASCDRVIAAIKAVSRRARRTASVCTGAYLLAAAGLLDGRRAATHWRHAAHLQCRHPSVRVDSDRIFVHDGPIWSSAGISAGIDLALALIEADFGNDLSRSIADEIVVYHRRSGGQSQFSALKTLQPGSDRIRMVLEFARANLTQNLSVERLASTASLSPRQFTRRFRAETGQTPARAVERLRIEQAQRLIATRGRSLEQIARAVGFYNADRMRRSFIRLYGQPPEALRRSSGRV